MTIAVFSSALPQTPRGLALEKNYNQNSRLGMEQMKNQFDDMAGEEKLRMLREADSARPWATLEDKRHCVLCEKIITGRQIRISWSKRGSASLHCPTRGCSSTPAEWVHPENPLVSEDAWRDWVRLLGALCDEQQQSRQGRQFRPRYEALAMAPGSRLAD